MLRRQLSDSMVAILAPLLSNIRDDWELQVEIRDGSVTIYYRGAALLRDVRLQGDNLTASVHYKYVPLERPKQSEYLPVIATPTGLGFPTAPQPLPLMTFEPGVVLEYKRMMRSVSAKPEASVVHGIVSRQENRVVDQELKFQESGQPDADKIDICHFDVALSCLSLVEVKGIHDSRLRRLNGQVPEVIEQLRRYRTRIEQHRVEIVQGCRDSIALKRRLGLAARLNGVPEDGPLSLLRKPILVIGDCSRDEVRAILEGEGEWRSMRDGLDQEAAGLILCGRDGCNLRLQTGRQTLVFDQSVL